MNCPACATPSLQAHQCQGIAVAACTGCGGVWLPRTALEALNPPPATASAQAGAPAASPGSLTLRHRDTRHLGQRAPRTDVRAGRQAATFMADLLDL